MEIQVVSRLINDQTILFATRLAGNYFKKVGMFVEFEDLRSTALLALCESAHRYDDNRGVEFTTFAYARIQGALRNYTSKQQSRSRENREETPNREDRTSGYAPGVRCDALASEALGVTLHRRGESLGEEQLSYTEQRSPADECEFRKLLFSAKQALRCIPATHRKIIELHYWEGMPLVEIAKVIGDFSKSWASSNHYRALSKLATIMTSASPTSPEIA